MQKLAQQKVNEFKSQGYLIFEDFVSSEVLSDTLRFRDTLKANL